MTDTINSDEEDILLTSDDAYRSGFCARGLFHWLVSNGFNARSFMKNGLRLSEITKVNDAFSQSIVAYVRGNKKKKDDNVTL